MTNETIATNDAFADLLVLMQIHKQKDFILELFNKKGWDVSRAKLKSWSVRSNRDVREFRPMPVEALRDFVDALHEAKLHDAPPITSAHPKSSQPSAIMCKEFPILGLKQDKALAEMNQWLNDNESAEWVQIETDIRHEIPYCFRLWYRLTQA